MIDLQAVKNQCNGNWKNVLNGMIPGEVRLDGKHSPCPCCGGKDRFRFDDKNGDGTWICNQCGNGDGIELVKRIKRLTLPETLKLLNASKITIEEKPAPAQNSRKENQLNPVYPAPDPIPPALSHATLGEPVAVWRYHTPNGGLMALAARYEGPDGKVFTPWLFEGGKWVCKAWPAPRPLYNLHQLAKRPTAPVILVEGEKAADVATTLFPGAVATTGMNGASWHASHDLEPLRGRVVILIPDADKPGMRYMAKMEERLKALAAAVQTIRLPDAIAIQETHGWDVADGGPHQEAVCSEVKKILANSQKKKKLYLEGDIEWRVQEIFAGIGRECGLYVWGDTLVRLGDVRGVRQIQEIDAQRLQVFLSERFEVYGKDSAGDWHAKTLPLQTCNYILAKSPENWPFPPIERIIRAPVYGTNRTLALSSGYHESVQAWLELDALKLEVPQSPTSTDVEEALLIIEDSLSDFPFQDAASYANTIALLLLPFVRLLINGPTPLHLISAPVQGTGKSMLAELIALIATGQPANVLTEGGDDAEWRKKITATLMRSPTCIVLDNINRKLDSGALASVLTSRVIEDRMLGTSKTLQIQNDAVWIGTANNPSMTGEIARRVIWIRLNPNTETPWNRDGFRHDPLLPWARENRQVLLRACLTLIQNWIAQGSKPGKTILGSFEEWAKTMSGILEAACVADFMENAKTLYDVVNEEAVEWREFVEKWHDRHKMEPVRAADLYKIALEHGYFEESLGDGTERSRTTKMGLILKKNVDRVFGPYRIRKKRTFMNGAIFTLEPEKGS